MTKKQSQPKEDQDLVASLEEQIRTLTEQLTQAQEKERRAMADYQNLLRRTQEDKIKFAKMANRDVLESLLQPLEHLSLAASQIHNPGLDMVLNQLRETLESFGLQEIPVLGKEFDVETMEVVENTENDSNIVTSVVKKGYTLHGQVIQHAKVILGDQKKEA